MTEVYVFSELQRKQGLGTSGEVEASHMRSPGNAFVLHLLFPSHFSYIIPFLSSSLSPSPPS